MKATLGVEKLKEMVSRATNGVGNNKLIPITGLMAIEARDNKLTLITTDATNYLYIIEDKVVTDDFYAVVDANIFSKLVAKMTCENVTLEINSALSVLEVVGNGKYKIELPLDENGQTIRYPNPMNDVDLNNFTTEKYINKTTVQVILESIKPALAITLENPCYTGYYIGNQVVATDTYKIASMDIDLFGDKRLVSPEFMERLSVMKAEKISVQMTETDIICSTADCVVVGKFMEGIEDFAIDPIMDVVNTKFNSMCSVSKNLLIQVLDRIALFVGPYDKSAVNLTFTKDGLQISSKAATGIELINYVTSSNFIDFTCTIDIQMLVQEIKAIKSDVVEVYYGENNGIKLVDGNIVIIVALLEDDI